MITLAFYKGRASNPWHRFQDGVIRRVTGGVYSHVELIAGSASLGAEHLCLSASGRDGGVRAKVLTLKPAHWDLVELINPQSSAVRFIRDRIGARYDYRGLILSQVFALGRHSADRWFCSEICAAALGLPNPQRLSPQMLFDVVTWNDDRMIWR